MTQQQVNRFVEGLMDEGLMHSDAKIVPFSTIIKNAIMPSMLAPFDEINLASTISINKARHMAKEKIRNERDLKRVMARYGLTEEQQARILRDYTKRAFPMIFGDEARNLAKQLTDELYPVFITMLQYVLVTTYDKLNNVIGGTGEPPTSFDTKWSGKTLRLILYTVIIDMLRKRNQAFLEALFLEKNNAYVLQLINETVNKTLSKVKSISRTETSQIVNTAILNVLKDNGIEKYVFLATLDDRTSTTCRSLHGMVFNVADALRGVNLPPMHPNCRSVIAPYLIQII